MEIQGIPHRSLFAGDNAPLSGLQAGPSGAEAQKGPVKLEQKDQAALAELISVISCSSLTDTDDVVAGSDDPTGLDNILIVPECEELIEDLEELLALLQMATTERQLELAQERIKQLKDQIQARCSQQLAVLEESIEKMREAARSKTASKIFGWLGALVSAVVFVALCAVNVVTGGVATPLLVMSGVATAMALGGMIASETGLAEKMTEGIADIVQDIFGCSKRDAQIAAMAVQVAFTLAIAIGGIAVSFVCPSNCAESVRALVTAISSIAGLIQGTAGVGAAASGIANSVYTYEQQMAEAELLEIQKFLTLLQKHLEEENKDVQQLMELIQGSLSSIMEFLRSASNAKTDINEAIRSAMI